MFVTCKVRSVVNGALRVSVGCTNPAFSLMVYIVGLKLRETARTSKNFNDIIM